MHSSNDSATIPEIQNTLKPAAPSTGAEDITSIVIPVFNEEKAIERVIKELHQTLIQQDAKYEIIVVDDGSTDGSGAILRSMDHLRYVRHSKNIGYGAALKTGIKLARGSTIVITDADGTYPNERIPAFVKDLEECDMVVGARPKDSSNVPFLRKLMKWFLGKLANFLSETDIPDLNSGLRAFRKDVALRFYKLLPSGFSFTTTITLAMHTNGYKVKYVPIEYGKREGKSKIRPIYDSLNFIQLIWRTIMYFNPLKVFLPIAGVVFCAFVVSALVDIIVSNNLTDKTVMLMMAFIQVLVMGLLADLIDKRSP